MADSVFPYNRPPSLGEFACRKLQRAFFYKKRLTVDISAVSDTQEQNLAWREKLEQNPPITGNAKRKEAANRFGKRL